MTLFKEVKPEEFPNFREGHRGRVSYPIVKAFMESGFRIAQIDRTDVGKTANSLKALLSWYCKSHDLPIKFLTRQGELYFVRLDINEDGSPNPDWKEEELPPPGNIPPLSGEEVDKHAKEK